MDEDRLGIRIRSEVVEIVKDPKGLVGVSIGGGHPYCPCVYVVQIFEGSPVDVDGRVKCGDEIVAVNGKSVKGEKKSNVAQLIQKAANPVKMTVNHLEVEPERGKTMDIVMKKIKHKMVEFMETDTADALGLSRAILCNDPLLKKMNILENNANLYRTLVDELSFLLRTTTKIAEMQKVFGDAFCEVGAHESEVTVAEALTQFGNSHRLLEKRQEEAVKQLTPLVRDLSTYVEHAVPDTQLTVKKYLDVKYEYLSYCLKLKEMDDEEMELLSLGDPLYRVETGNYEYRVMLRCRQDARAKFVMMRNDVMVKIELLDQKHVRDMAMQLSRFAQSFKRCQADCAAILESTATMPLEIDIAQKIAGTTVQKLDDEGIEEAEEAEEALPDQMESVNLLDMGDGEGTDLYKPVPTNGNDLIDMS
ncbi:hypothetical protein PENTCL1PPCAC_17794 [Pristionchus entomophagus]|uniref:PRKCA-binding protein n=1 Tax=Pristionchus entomophagus TaxID=358040 RepID=A0AAV5TNJ4_9BILA|nr:hypothetical protein PENTCL1PPCAC_17794 [Pristionchus entomophagus]